MRVQEIMCDNPFFIAPTVSLKEAAKKMKEKDIGFLPIGENDRLIGVITDRDIVVRGFAKDNNVSDLSVRDVMTPKVLYCFEDDNVEDAADKMRSEKVHRMIVLNRNKRIRGILTTGDIASKSHDHSLCAKTMEDICSD